MSVPGAAGIGAGEDGLAGANVATVMVDGKSRSGTFKMPGRRRVRHGRGRAVDRRRSCRRSPSACVACVVCCRVIELGRLFVGLELLLDAGELHELLGELVGVERIERVLVLQLRRQQRAGRSGSCRPASSRARAQRVRRGRLRDVGGPGDGRRGGGGIRWWSCRISSHSDVDAAARSEHAAVAFARRAPQATVSSSLMISRGHCRHLSLFWPVWPEVWSRRLKDSPLLPVLRPASWSAR